LCGTYRGFFGYGVKFLSVEEEIEMLEEAKTTLEKQLGNVKNRLEKLRA
jgi:hypothetical protein